MDSDSDCFYDCSDDSANNSGATAEKIHKDPEAKVSCNGEEKDDLSENLATLHVDNKDYGLTNKAEDLGDENVVEKVLIGDGEIECNNIEDSEILFNDSMTEAEKEESRKNAMELKEDGNKLFKRQDYLEAERLYSDGLRVCPSCFSKERAVLFSNRSACRQNLDKKSAAIEDCSEALKLDPRYLKPLLRRAQLHEEADKLDEALADHKAALELDPSLLVSRMSCARLPKLIEEQNEKLKAEMMGTLKELGNKVLGKFGLSTDNFKLEQNPDTGGYNIQFQQNPNTG